jgi:hypothetical protein
MPRRDIYDNFDFFEYVCATDAAPAAEPDRIDVALLDMHHGWPNIGHDALVHAVLDVAEESRDTLLSNGVKVRVISFDVRRHTFVPEASKRFALFIGTGGPGHLDPRLNDGSAEWTQGISETPVWEAPLFRLFDAIHKNRDAAMIGICHSFGLMCRWSGTARPVLREKKSSGIPLNTLTEDALRHPWFSQFAAKLPDRRSFRVVDNRLFDLVLNDTCGAECLAFESDDSKVLTMVEFAREADGTMPRMLGMNYHPEIIDREHVLTVLDEKRAHHDVTDDWYNERRSTLHDLFHGEVERQSRLTSEYSLIGPLRFQIGKLVGERCSTAV